MMSFSSSTNRPSPVLLQSLPTLPMFQSSMEASTAPTKLELLVSACAAIPQAATPELAQISGSGLLQQLPQALPKRRRRRVRFELPQERPNVAQQEEEAEAPEIEVGLTEERKSELWVRKSEIRATVKNMRSAFCGIEADSDEAADLAAYGEALTTAYVACALQHEQEQEQEQDSAARPCAEEQLLAASVTAQHAGLFGSSIHETPDRSVHRGLENCASPLLAVERSNKRREDIRNIVGLYKALRHQRLHPDDPVSFLLIRGVAENLSSPSRKLAQVMGVSDSMAALMEYSGATSTDSTAVPSYRKGRRSYDDAVCSHQQQQQPQKKQRTSCPAA